MVIRKEELALYSLSVLEQDDRPNIRYDKVQLALALDIIESTLDLYLTKLKNAGSIVRHKKKYVDDVRQTYDLTEKGKDELKKIMKKIPKEILTPERHNIPSIIPITTILSRIHDPLEKIFFLALYSKLKRFDLPFYLETLKTAKQDSAIVNVINDIEAEEVSENMPVIETFFRTCFYGDIAKTIEEDTSSLGTNVNTLLIVAEASYKQGRYNEARQIYDHLLSANIGMNQNQWFIANIGSALLTSKEGRIEEAVSFLEELEDAVDNRVFKAFTKQVRARILSTTDRREESLELFDSSIRSFRSAGVPLLLSIAHNNRGILYFRMERFEKAEDDWKKAKRFSMEAGSNYQEATIIPNIADIEILKGNTKKAKALLDRSMGMFQDVNDSEGIAVVNFNYSLLYLKEGNLESALSHFRRSETVAYPSPSPLERKERREVFMERAQKNGFKEVELDT